MRVLPLVDPKTADVTGGGAAFCELLCEDVTPADMCWCENPTLTRIVLEISDGNGNDHTESFGICRSHLEMLLAQCDAEATD